VFDGTVTAVASAPATGEVFLGFETGEVYAFRPDRSETVLVSEAPLPVASLATDDRGACLVVLRGLGPGFAGIISSLERRPDGAYRNLLGYRTSELTEPWLTPVARHSEGTVFSFWEGEDLLVMSATSLTVARRLRALVSDGAPSWALILDTEDVASSILWHNGPEWFLSDAERKVSATGLHWRPERGEGSSLRSTPVSWASFAPGNLDLAGLGEFGTLHWGRLEGGELVAKNTLPSPTEGGYLAAAVVRDGLVAGVTRDRIEWLRCGPSKFQLWRASVLAIPSAVACFPSRPTRELVVVTRDGSVARVAIPV
jgi:hypothetical protein